MGDLNSAIDKLMESAILQSQSLEQLMAKSCSGDANGKDPASYPVFVQNCNKLMNGLNALRLQLKGNQLRDAGPQIDAAQNTLEEMAKNMYEACPGGRSGVHPLHYGDLIN